jgi:hypothetical protein
MQGLKTKEEILDENDISFNDLEESESAEKTFHKAMAQHSEQMAIAFAEYLAELVNIQYGFQSISELYNEFIRTLTPKP